MPLKRELPKSDLKIQWNVIFPHCVYASNTSNLLHFLVLLLDSYKSHSLEPHAASHLSKPVPEPMSRTVVWPFPTALVMACLKAAFLPTSLSIGRCHRSTKEFANLPCSSWAQGSLGHPIWAKQAWFQASCMLPYLQQVGKWNKK